VLDGTGDYLTLPASADWAFGTGDYCVELQRRSTVTASIRCTVSTYASSTSGWSSLENVSGAGSSRWYDAGDGSIFDGPVTAINTWARNAFVRVGGIAMELIEGELVNFVASPTSITNTIAMYIGRVTTASTVRDWTGQIQEVRVIKGQSPYTQSFKVQTAPHSDS
jgi:hypothetical protein